LLAPCVLLPFAISAGYVRWLLAERLSRWEAGAGYALALIATCWLFLVLLVDWLDYPIWPPELLAYFLLAFGAGAWFVIQNVRTATPPVPNALVVMQVVYLPFALYFMHLPVLTVKSIKMSASPPLRQGLVGTTPQGHA
ncbi:MAG: hypothetical protein ACE5H7_07685, partial [Acidiferrobacterales bacterium]